VTVADVVNSPMISDPLHRLDCCVITDGGGAIVVVKPEIAARLARPRVRLLGAVEAVRQLRGEAHPKVQVKNCDVALAHGTGGSLGTRHGSATLIMEREA